MPKRLTWKLRKRINPVMHELSVTGEKWLMIVQSIYDEQDGVAWFYYGCGTNTSGSPVKSLDEAKKLAKAHALTYLKNHAHT